MGKVEFELLLKLIGDNIKKYRKLAGLSQEALAFETGSERSYMGAVERGEKRASVFTLYKISKALNIQISDLFVKEQAGL
jgi:transcriptional regulator with XRE-family HTH domain